MIVVFLGPPGCGKGTQAKILSQELGYLHVSTGDLLREEIEKNDEFSDQIKELSSSGKLVSDELINAILHKKLNFSENIILDGYPRTIDQAKFLDAYSNDKIKVVYFVISNDDLHKRISGRILCRDCGAIFNTHFKPLEQDNICNNCRSQNIYRREDDNLDVFETRIEEYNNKIEPLLSFYETKGHLYKVSAINDMSVITNHLLSILKND